MGANSRRGATLRTPVLSVSVVNADANTRACDFFDREVLSWSCT